MYFFRLNNAKLIPPIRFARLYEPMAVWAADDFFGNAFFVREPGRAFDDVPSAPDAVLRPAMYAPRAPRPTSGLIEQQRYFRTLRRP